jgi:MFS family permease
MFQKVAQERALARYPSAEILKKKLWVVLACAGIQVQAVVGNSGLVNPFSPSVLLSLKLVTPSLVTLGLTFGSLGGAIGSLTGGHLGDKIGRKKVAYIGALLLLGVSYPFFLLLLTGSYLLIFFAYLIMGFAVHLAQGAGGALYTEQFETKYRYSGTGQGITFAALLGGLVITFVIPAIVSTTGGPALAWPYVASLGVIVALISIVAIGHLKEKKELTE